MSEAEKLQRCPFCGGIAALDSLCDDEGDPWGEVKLVYHDFWVRCRRCRVATDWYVKPSGAVKAWNRRAQSAFSARKENR